MSAFADLEKAVDDLPTSTHLTSDVWCSSGSHMPEHVTFAELANEASRLSCAGADWKALQGPRSALVAILASLKNKDKIRRVPGDDAEVQQLCEYAAAAVAPRSTTEDGRETEDDHDPDYEEFSRRVRVLAPYGVEILWILSGDYGAKLSEDTLLTTISFTDTSSGSDGVSGSYPWTNPEASRLAGETVEGQLASHYHEDDLLVETILKRYLRPMFSKSRPKAVTASGRKAEFPDEDDPHRGLSDENKEVKPWKYADHRALAVFQWAVRVAKEDLISKQWPLFIPVLLTLVDDGATRVRARGLAILNDFLVKFPDNVLSNTGLASVFEDAVFPTLHFLPSITPEEESIQLLEPAYSALLTLARKADTRAEADSESGRTPRAKGLDKLLREGTFSSYFHTKEHVRIVRVLFAQTAEIVRAMGIQAVKHLKDLVPMHSEFMTNPFAPLAPDTLQSALCSLETVILNCWPRLSTPAYQDELIKTLTVCFLNVHDESDRPNQGLVQIKTSLAHAAALLSKATKKGAGEGNSLKEKVAPLIAQEPLLAELFKDF